MLYSSFNSVFFISFLCSEFMIEKLEPKSFAFFCVCFRIFRVGIYRIITEYLIFEIITIIFYYSIYFEEGLMIVGKSWRSKTLLLKSLNRFSFSPLDFCKDHNYTVWIASWNAFFSCVKVKIIFRPLMFPKYFIICTW